MGRFGQGTAETEALRQEGHQQGQAVQVTGQDQSRAGKWGSRSPVVWVLQSKVRI